MSAANRTVPHCIRLAGPWTYRILAIAGRPVEQAKGDRVTLPLGCADLPTADVTTVAYERSFHAPTNLTDRDELYLVAAGVVGSGMARLNGGELGPIAPAIAAYRWRLPSPLLRRNLLSIELTRLAEPVDGWGMTGDVALEIVSNS